MNFKKIVTGVIGFPIVLAFLVLANKYLVDILMTVLAIISMYEYSKCAKNKEIKVVTWLGYLSCLLIAVVHLLPTQLILLIIAVGYPLLIFILFLHVIFTDMKINFRDICFSLFGYLYIIGFIMFFVLVFGTEKFCFNLSGKTAIWFVLCGSWGSDTIAYFVGKNLGKHKFSKVSPSKTIEGCIGGIVGPLIAGLIFTYCINRGLGTTLPYLYVAILVIVLSIIGELGDFAASAIKRYFEVKDYSNLFPGHGGVLDRIDSIIFVAPFAYAIFIITGMII